MCGEMFIILTNVYSNKIDGYQSLSAADVHPDNQWQIL